MADSVTTPPELAGGTYTSTLTSKANELKQALIDQTLEDLDSWDKALRNQWELDHPNAPTDGPIGMVPADKMAEYRSTVRNDYYSWVVPAFDRYKEPDPDSINTMITSLRTMESHFQGSEDGGTSVTGASNALTRINDARTDMNYWQGDLQENFIDNFLTPLQTASMNQSSIAKISREQLECSKVLYIRRRKSILKLLDQSIDAVHNLKQGRSPESYMWGTLIAIAVGTGLTIASGGLAAAGAVLVIGGTLAQGVAPDPPESNNISAPTAQEVAVNISDALTKLDTDVSKEEDKVTKAFHNISEPLADSLAKAKGGSSSPVAVHAPEVSGAKPGDVTDGSLRPS